MPPKKIIEHTVYIIDCNSSIETKLEQLYSIYSTKVFYRATKTKSADRNKIILLKNTVEPLTDWTSYRLQQLKNIRNACLAEKPDEPHNHNNFFKAINLAVSSLNQIEDKKNILIKRIIILSDLQSSINDKDKHVERINGAIYASSATVYIIGVESSKTPQIRTKRDMTSKLFKLDYIEDIKNPEFMNSLNVVRRLSEKNIMVLNFDDGYNILFSYKEQIKAPYPWYVGLGIGTDIRIPVMTNKTIRKHFNVRTRRAPVLEGLKYTTDKRWFDLDTHEEVPMHDVLKGYKYHGKFVTFTPEQELEMGTKKKSSKCLGIVAFVAADQIPINLYAFENSMNKVRPDKRSPRYTNESFRLLVGALRAKNVVAIAKRVYNNGNNPNLFALFPCPEHKTNNYLLMAQIPYAHQFIDRFYRGTKCKLENTNPEIKENVYKFLDAMNSGNYPNGQPIHPLPEKFKFNMNRARQYKFIAKKNLQEETGDPPILKINQYLEKQAQEHADNLLKYLNH